MDVIRNQIRFFSPSLFGDLRVEAIIVLKKSTDNYVSIDELTADIFFESLEVRKIYLC